MSSEQSAPMRESVDKIVGKTVYKEKVFACICEEHKKMRRGVCICKYGRILTIKETTGLQKRPKRLQERLQERVSKRRGMGSGLRLSLHQRNPKETPKKNVKVIAGIQGMQTQGGLRYEC
jgi:hypothetical protein